MTIFTEEEFAQKMKTDVAEWRKHKVEDGIMKSNDGTNLQYYFAVQPNAKASIVIMHGFGEFFAKYHEISYYFYQEGYSVYFVEQRGHGLSDRKVPDLGHVYVKDYSEYVEDQKIFFDGVVAASEPNTTKILFAHSMGGAIAALYLEKYHNDYTAAILNSPMCALKLDIPAWKIDSMIAMVTIKKQQTALAPGQKEFSEKPDFENSSCQSKARYDYQFSKRLSRQRYQMHASTYGWLIASIKASKKLLAQAGRIQTPILVCQAGIDNRVDPQAQVDFVSGAPGSMMAQFPKAKHEIFNSQESTLKVYYKILFDFLDSYCS